MTTLKFHHRNKTWVSSRSTAMANVAYKRSWREFFFTKSPWRPKEGKTKNERRGLWKLPQRWKSIKVAFGIILLDDFHRCLENPAGFPTVTTGPAAIHLLL
ncbi:MAG TPA: hypothetical protein VFE29_08780 [Terriglobia bacterium]|nr:hypothetical protein [Terriglobia bacterium]